MLIPEPLIDGSAAKLPSTMAGLLQCAIDDARKLDRAAYLPHHDEWHSPNQRYQCKICLAGAVIAGGLNISSTDYCTTSFFDSRTEDLLDALDNMRYGHWKTAFTLIYDFTPPLHIDDYLREIPEAAHSRFFGWEQFDAHLKSMAELLPDLEDIDRVASRHARSLRLRTVAFPSPQDA